jgi:hypothetical protein
MPEEYPDRPVKVTAEPRSHPAIRKLARACIALARWQREQEVNKAAAPTEQAGTLRPKATEPDEEGRHD